MHGDTYWDIKIESLPECWKQQLETLMGDSVYVEELYSPRDTDDSLPIPWDGFLWREGDEIVLEGGAGPHGYGYAKSKFPRKNIDKVLMYEVRVETEYEQDFEAILQKHGVEWTKKGRI